MGGARYPRLWGKWGAHHWCLWGKWGSDDSNSFAKIPIRASARPHSPHKQSQTVPPSFYQTPQAPKVGPPYSHSPSARLRASPIIPTLPTYPIAQKSPTTLFEQSGEISTNMIYYLFSLKNTKPYFKLLSSVYERRILLVAPAVPKITGFSTLVK